MTINTPRFRHLAVSLSVCLGLLLLISDVVAAAAGTTKRFDLPAGDALSTLRSFSAQSGEQLLYSANDVRDIKTAAVQGSLTSQEALNRMFAGTELFATRDEKTGAFNIARIDPNAPRAALEKNSGRPDQQARAPDEPVALSPFEVRADSDNSYGALNANSITSFNTELHKMPISADIFTEAFMRDIGPDADSLENMILTYSPGAAIGNFNGTDPNANQPNDRVAYPAISLRGLSGIRPQRDGFMGVTNGTGSGYTNSFDTERVEVIQGPQSLLYGVGGGGGAINIVSKKARFDSRSFGSFRFRVDQYGSKSGQLDLGLGGKRFAVRFAAINETMGGRRVNIGGPLHGTYGQVAFKPFSNTTIRLSAEQSTFFRFNPTNFSLTALSTANDARNGMNLHYLLATNQINAAANGAPSGAGPINNGNVNWGNVDSFAGARNGELTTYEWGTLTADTVWTPWLSTQVNLGMVTVYNFSFIQGFTLWAPNAAANPAPGQWQIGDSSAIAGLGTDQPQRKKALQVSALFTNDLFRGRAHSRTVLGYNFQEPNTAQHQYAYYLADSNWNVVVNPAVTANQGRTGAPKFNWPMTPLTKYPWFRPGTPRITYNGNNYVYMHQNQINPALVSPNNPLGVTGSGLYTANQNIYSAPYIANTTQWLDRRLETLTGFRYDRAYNNLNNPRNTAHTNLYLPSFTAGANYAVRDWLRPYFSVSDSYNPGHVFGPYGLGPETSKALGEEVGVKVQNATGTISGSLAVFHTKSKNEQYTISTTLVNNINPTGLNGRLDSPSTTIAVDRVSKGLQAVLSAAPTPSWRLRFAGMLLNGKIGTSTSYAQLYNDQFYQNSQGQVTYADGAVVYVATTFNSTTPAYTAANAPAGSAPLTITAMSTPGNIYYANPNPITAHVATGTAVRTVLQAVDPVHGSIATGKVGLPISSLQIDPRLSGVVIPGTIITSVAGDQTTGYPEFSVTFTGMYTVREGMLKGLHVGGTFNGGWRTHSFYYYTSAGSSTRVLFSDPPSVQVNPILGYSHKFGRYTYRTQLNGTNLFNHYQVLLRPNANTGFSVPTGVNAAFWQQPRAWTWTNTIEF